MRRIFNLGSGSGRLLCAFLHLGPEADAISLIKAGPEIDSKLISSSDIAGRNHIVHRARMTIYSAARNVLCLVPLL